MNKFRVAVARASILKNIYRLFLFLSPRRRIQVFFLLILQVLCAVFEMVSIGAVIPFLSALADTEALMRNAHISALMNWIGISSAQHLVLALAIVFSLGIILTNMLRFVTLCVQQYLSAAIAVDLGKSLTLKILSKPYPYFLNENTSQIIGNTTNDLDGTGGVLINIFSFFVSSFIAITISFGLFVYNPELAILLSLIVLTAYSVIMIFVNRYLRYNGLLASDAYRNIIKSLQEACGGIRYIILGRLQDHFEALFSKENKAFRVRHANNGVILQAPKLLLESIAVLAISGITVWFVMQGKNITDMIPLMGFLVFGCYRLLPAVQQMYASIGSIVGLSASLERVIGMLAGIELRSVSKVLRQPLCLKNSLDFERVCFRYDSSNPEWTIKDVTFSIKAKTIVALVGHTGSGKSTISDLILGLISPQQGIIRVDGRPLEEDSVPNWQESIAHVPQSVFLSDATIAENVAFGVPVDQVDIEQVKKACKVAQISDFIEGLDKKYDEFVGERGARLSGGQSQRIGIARALYKNPHFIVFDEATSALDNKTERDVVAAISRFDPNLTVIFIAHRLSTVQHADNILLFGNGRLLAQGTYEQLLAHQSFQELVHSKEFSA